MYDFLECLWEIEKEGNKREIMEAREMQEFMEVVGKPVNCHRRGCGQGCQEECDAMVGSYFKF